MTKHLVLLAVLLPPVAVFIKYGLGVDFVTSILLTLMGFIPGVIHGLWIVLLG